MRISRGVGPSRTQAAPDSIVISITCAIQSRRDLAHITIFPTGLVSFQIRRQPPTNRRLHMRKFILIAALVLVSAAAQARGTRSLTLASSDESAKVEQPKAAEAPKSVATPRPSFRQQSRQELQQSGQGMQQSRQRLQRPDPVTAAKYAVAVKVEKLKRQGASTLARVRYALHRHGIYW